MFQFLSLIAVVTLGNMAIILPSGGKPQIVTSVMTLEQCQHQVSTLQPNASRAARDAHGDAIIDCVRAVDKMIKRAGK